MDANEFRERRRRLAGQLGERKLDAFVVSWLPNIRYLTGFTGSNGLLLLSPGDAILFTDPRYGIQASQEAACRVRVARGSLHLAAMKAAQRRKFRRIGFEAARLTYEAFETIRGSLPLGASAEPVSGLVENQRMVKSAAEIALIRRSVLTNSKAFERAMRKVRPGMREAELAAEIEYQMRLLGADKAAFETIVTAGPRTALPHGQPTSNTLTNNQLLLVDMGASQEGYASDMTRMACLGRPGRKAKALYSAVLEAQLAAIAAVRPGVPAGRVDRAARQILRGKGFDKEFVHSTGHGLGLEIHEPPRIGRRVSTPLAAGMAITIEPGAYIEGFGGVRIEDTVVVTASGCEVLTPTSKELLEL